MGGEGSGKPNGELLRLDGVAMIDGKIEKTDFFNFLKMDLTEYKMLFTPEEALSFKNTVVRMTYGMSAAIPLHCYGKTCINKICPLHKSQKYPIGQPCLFETRLIQTLTMKYVEEFEVDPESISEMTLVNTLVECDIIDLRANIGLSGARNQEDGTLLLATISESDSGVHKEEINIHPLLDAKDRASAKKIKILDSFVATRREKYKKASATGTSEETDSSKRMAEQKRLSLEAMDAMKKITTASKEIILEGDWSTSDL